MVRLHHFRSRMITDSFGLYNDGSQAVMMAAVLGILFMV